jgi:hypothetical protein
MSHKLAQELRESAKATFYDPLKSELNRAADRIDELMAALDKYQCNCVGGITESVREVLEGTCSD